MKPNTFVIVFMIIWMRVIGLGCLGIILAGIIRFKAFSQTGFSPILLVPFGMFIFGCSYLHYLLKWKVKNQKYF